MSEQLLRRYIMEIVQSLDLDQSLVKKDDTTGKPIIRKLVTFRKPGTRFRVGDNLNTDVNNDGNIVVDDMETWEPDLSKEKVKTGRTVHRVA
jgi:hypothetical protein